jgi:hypothetical protein
MSISAWSDSVRSRSGLLKDSAYLREMLVGWSEIIPSPGRSRPGPFWFIQRHRPVLSFELDHGRQRNLERRSEAAGRGDGENTDQVAALDELPDTIRAYATASRELTNRQGQAFRLGSRHGCSDRVICSMIPACNSLRHRSWSSYVHPTAAGLHLELRRLQRCSAASPGEQNRSARPLGPLLGGEAESAALSLSRFSLEARK